MSLAALLRRHGVGTVVSIREVARRAGIDYGLLGRALRGEEKLSEPVLVRLAVATGADAIDVVCAGCRVPKRVVAYLARHPELVHRLNAHAEAEEADLAAAAAGVTADPHAEPVDGAAPLEDA